MNFPWIYFKSGCPQDASTPFWLKPWLEETASEQQHLQDGAKKEKIERDRGKPEEMPKTAVETVGKTQKRKSESTERRKEN